jgi:type IV/VI secretion system ImpK/VasF family protein
MTHFGRQLKHGNVGAPEQVRYEALSALRDAEDLARNDPAVERLWSSKVKAMMVYFIDYKMLNSDWPGRAYWSDQPFETDPQVLMHAQALGGEEFFRDCDEIQKEFEVAERRERRDADELAEMLSLYFVCLRLGFKGQFHDRPQELADYTRRLFTRLPAYASTRAKEMFPEAYRHNQELRMDYRLGLGLSIVLLTLGVIVAASVVSFRVAWRSAVGAIRDSAAAWVSGG